MMKDLEFDIPVHDFINEIPTSPGYQEKVDEWLSKGYITANDVDHILYVLKRGDYLRMFMQTDEEAAELPLLTEFMRTAKEQIRAMKAKQQEK